MQQTSPKPPNAAFDPSGVTTFSFILIAVLALLTIAAIVWGARLKRRRREAEEIQTERLEAAEAESPAPSAPPSLDQEPVAPATRPPVAPPPPLDPEPVPAISRPATPEPPQPSLQDEPIAAAAPLEASPAIEAEPAAADAVPEPEEVAATPAIDPATRPITIMKGVGPRLATRLGEEGVATVGDIAALDDRAAAALDARLGNFTGRMARDRWIEQARLLAAGDDKGFEAAFGRL